MSYSFNPIGLVRTPFTDPAQIPKGLGAEHRKAGVIEVEEAYEPGLADIGRTASSRRARPSGRIRSA